MKIIDIEMTAVEIPVIPLTKGGIAPYKGSQDKVGTTQTTSLFFKVLTDEGIFGWGEMNAIINLKVTRALLEDYIKPLVIGNNPFDINKIMRKFAPVYNPQLNTKCFLTAIETACWDIMGKALNKPLYELLGGKVRDRIEICYCTGMMEPEELKDKAQQIKEQGYRTMKTKGGVDILADIRRAKALREANGADFEIRVDMNQGYDTPQALRYLREVEDLDLQYIEQPIGVNKFDDLKMLRARTRTPIGINEDCYIPNNLLNAVKQGCVDIAIVDFEPLGGLSELIRIAHLAQEASLPLAHHCGWDMGVKLAAILHVTSTLPAFTYPMDSTYPAHADDVLTEAVPVIGGGYSVPNGPGLGVEVDEEKVRRLAIGRA